MDAISQCSINGYGVDERHKAVFVALIRSILRVGVSIYTAVCTAVQR